jgi:hypothetical protein
MFTFDDDDEHVWYFVVEKLIFWGDTTSFCRGSN